MNLITKKLAVLMTIVFSITLTACSSPDDSPLSNLQRADNYTKTVYNDQYEEDITQILKVDGDKMYYQIPSGSLYITYERGFFYFISRNQTINAYVDEYNTGNYQKVALDEDPVESYIVLETLNFGEHFEIFNEIYRLKESYLGSEYFKNLGELNDVFLKFEDDDVIFTIFINETIGESVIQIIYSDINETTVTIPS